MDNVGDILVRDHHTGKRTNSDLCHLHKKLIGFYNRDEVFTARYGLAFKNEAVCASSFKG
jgi:hypothetical protein